MIESLEKMLHDSESRYQVSIHVKETNIDMILMVVSDILRERSDAGS